MQAIIVPKVVENVVTMDLAMEERGGISDGAMTAMKKLLESMVRYQEAAAKVQESKSDS